MLGRSTALAVALLLIWHEKQLDRALDLLRGVEYEAQSLTHFELGRAYEGLDQRERPSEAYTTAAALAPRIILIACAHECARSVANDRAAAPPSDQTFDNLGTFVLDIPFFSTIIYIWYEDGQLRPFLVRFITG